MVPFGATTKSPLNSGFLQTTILTESPGVNTACSLEARDSWADAGTESTTKARSVRGNRARIDLVESMRVTKPGPSGHSRATSAQSMPLTEDQQVCPPRVPTAQSNLPQPDRKVT